VRVLEAVPGEDADTAGAGDAAIRRRDLEEASDRGGRGRFAEDAFFAGEAAVGGKNLVVGDAGDGAAGLVPSGYGALPACRVADADGRGDGLRLSDRVAKDDRRSAGGLEAHHLRPAAESAFGVLDEALPVGCDVAGIADGDEEVVRRIAELVD